MSLKHVVTVKPGKESFIIENRHPWIFSGAIETMPEDLMRGDLAYVKSVQGDFLAIAYFHPKHSLTGRVLSLVEAPILEILRRKFQKALELRTEFVISAKTDCYRWIHAEADGLPGLIVDVYGSCLVVQISTMGMERLRQEIVHILQEYYPEYVIFEKSTSHARLLEGLEPVERVLIGTLPSELLVKEEGVHFCVSLSLGQKTGLFLDQREMRKMIRELARGKCVLNCFAYTGGFSLYALQGGADMVTSVDTCPVATQFAEKNTYLNGFSLQQHRIVREDVFAFLDRESLISYDLIIIDPPAFAKSRKDVEAACKGYHTLLERVFIKCRSGTIVLFSSCSYFVDMILLEQIAFGAAKKSNCNVHVLGRHRDALDHPVSLFHPEGRYLKSLLLWVDI